MHIEKIVIKNFKCFDGFELDLKRGINIIVGDNEVGKSTIIEAIHLALNGIMSGKYLRNELTEYLFNKSTLEKWKKDKIDLPEILIEIYINNDVQSDKISLTKGKNNSKHEDKYGLYFKVCFDKEYEQPYQEYLKSPDADMLPIEYYHIVWKSFGDDTMVTRNIPIKSILIDSVGSRYPSGSDMYINKIVRELSEVDNGRVANLTSQKFQNQNFFSSRIWGISLEIRQDFELILVDSLWIFAVLLFLVRSWRTSTLFRSGAVVDLNFE